MKKLKVMVLFSVLIGTIQGCSDDEATPDLISEIMGIWRIENINYQMCDAQKCEDNITEFDASGLTFEIRRDSVFYYPFVSSPETLNRFALHTVSGDTLNLKNNFGIWDFVIDERSAASLTIRGIVPTGSDVVFFDIISVSR